MDLNFYSELSDGCPQNVDAEFLDTQAYGEYPEENKVTFNQLYQTRNFSRQFWLWLMFSSYPVK